MMLYDSDDVQNILQIAMTRSQDDRFSQMQLQEMAAELGITSDILKTAEKEWLNQREESLQKQKMTTRRRRGFVAHLLPFLIVNTFLIVLNLMTTPRIFWAIYPLSGWSLGLFLHGWAAYQVSTKQAEKNFLMEGRCPFA